MGSFFSAMSQIMRIITRSASHHDFCLKVYVKYESMNLGRYSSGEDSSEQPRAVDHPSAIPVVKKPQNSLVREDLEVCT